jgi:hypothetical protein
VEMFQNHLTGVVRPISSTIKNTYVGGNMAYVIEFVGRDGKEEIVPIHPRDYELKIFKRFSLSAKSLKSKADLEHLLHEQMDKGNLACKSFVVYDLNELRKEAHDFYSGQVFRAKRCSAFQYYVMGWAATKYSDWKLERENARRRHAQQEKQK